MPPHVVEVSRILSSQIQSALHPLSIFVASKESAEELALVFSSSLAATSRKIGQFGLSPTAFDALEASTPIESFRSGPGCAPHDREYLDALAIRLIVPLRGPNEGFVGVILLGEKLSEEP